MQGWGGVPLAQEDGTGSSQSPEGREVCKFFLKTGTCAYGSRCKFDHPPSMRPVLRYNSLGLPVRPGEPDCAYYSRHMRCGFGAACRYNHLEPMMMWGMPQTGSWPSMMFTPGAAMPGGPPMMMPFVPGMQMSGVAPGGPGMPMMFTPAPVPMSPQQSAFLPGTGFPPTSVRSAPSALPPRRSISGTGMDTMGSRRPGSVASAPATTQQPSTWGSTSNLSTLRQRSEDQTVMPVAGSGAESSGHSAARPRGGRGRSGIARHYSVRVELPRGAAQKRD